MDYFTNFTHFILHDSYFALPSTLLRLQLELISLKIFDTDCKRNIFKSMETRFANAEHLLGWVHMKNSIQKKLTELSIKDDRLINCVLSTSLSLYA